ncbi:triose-phosphate isomerase [Fluviicola sp. SGL-29]|nr:triose-phosphate isomerase [Fluviicola sp. SGL-29]
MRRKIVAGNWKMNLDWDAANALFQSLKTIQNEQVEVIVFPSSLYLAVFSSGNNHSLKVGAQNAYPKNSGAYTGEIAFSQLKSIGVSHVLIGHSERRDYFSENNSFLKEKVDACLENGITPVFCCGESLPVREKNEETAFVTRQIEESLFHLSADEFKKCIIAYEPIWAIGTGLTATSEQAEQMHRDIRQYIAGKYGNETAEHISILYGGSCNEKNASELFSCPNVDGGLVGGASLKADSFTQIINAF